MQCSPVLAYHYQLLTGINTEKFQAYNTGSRYVVLISDMIIKYSRTMMVGTQRERQQSLPIQNNILKNRI